MPSADAGANLDAGSSAAQGEKRSRRGGRRRRGRGGRGGEGAGLPAAGGSNLNGNGSWHEDIASANSETTDARQARLPMAEPRPEPRPHTGTDLQPDAGTPPREASRPAPASPPPPPPPPERATVVWTSTTSGSAGSVDHSQREE